jgi:exodeoxyribonuclease VII large subunit
MTEPSENSKRKIYSVSEITRILRSILEEEFPDITVEGEVSNFRPSSTGHYYFSLKDKDSVISVVMFRNRAAFLRLKPKDGMMVRARGSLSVYPKRGTYQLICETLEGAGQGDILAMIEERKKRLAAEGLFDEARKKPLPLLPSRIAVVTSPTGAAIRDILRVLKRRNSGINLLVLPTPVQGDEAAPKIAEQIRIANLHRLADVLIVGRGGGSLEDLLPFYEEEVVRAIADSEIPVISAVGHEIDMALSDLAADLRAPTPSAAAELVTASRDELLRRVRESAASFYDALSRRVERAHLILDGFSRENLERNFRLLIQPNLMRFDDAKEALESGMRAILTECAHRLEVVTREMQAHSPLDVLKRGFSVITHVPTGKILRSSSQAEEGDSLDIRLYSGKLLAEVKDRGQKEDG